MPSSTNEVIKIRLSPIDILHKGIEFYDFSSALPGLFRHLRLPLAQSRVQLFRQGVYDDVLPCFEFKGLGPIQAGPTASLSGCAHFLVSRRWIAGKALRPKGG